MTHTATQLRAAAKQGATIVSTHPNSKGAEVEWGPMYRSDLFPWKGVDQKVAVASAWCEIVWKPDCRKEVHIPTIAKLVEKHFEGTGHQRANMPLNGGWAVSQTYWNMQSVAFVHWAYTGQEGDGTPSNMVERPLTDEVRGMHAMLKVLGYKVSNLREDQNFFHVS